ncbi:MAG: oligosaccharide flippase family protein, partial [Deltaproteobacteria bacterium]|nr:oligosaccharide flippase family protein [Deltaproteobacteria bacterium]
MHAFMTDQRPDSIRVGNVARGMLYNMVSKVSYLLCAYAINIFIGRYLGPEKYGIFGVVFALTNIAYLFLTSGLPQATSKYVGGDISKATPVMKAALKLQLPWSLFLFALFFAGAGPISSIILNDSGLAFYIRVAALTIVPLALFNVYQGALLGSAEFGKEAIGLILRSVIRLFSVIVFVLWGFGIKGAIAGYVCAAVAGAIIARSFCKFPASD